MNDLDGVGPILDKVNQAVSDLKEIIYFFFDVVNYSWKVLYAREQSLVFDLPQHLLIFDMFCLAIQFL